MVEKCGDHLIDSAQALTYDPQNSLLSYKRVAGRPHLTWARHDLE